MVEYTKNKDPNDTDIRHDQGKRNRIERRTASIWPLPKGSGTELWHDHFKTLICIDRVID
jgi:hypothetical protein